MMMMMMKSNAITNTPLSQTPGLLLLLLYTGWNQVTAGVIYGLDTICWPMFCGNTAYCAELNGVNLLRYSSKSESV